MYTYRIRPAYGSEQLLVEFVKGVQKDTFLTDLEAALSSMAIKLEKTEDLWMNDEVLFHFNSSEGKFLLSKNVWDCAYIEADENQRCINTIDLILRANEHFKKEEVDFSEFDKKQNRG